MEDEGIRDIRSLASVCQVSTSYRGIALPLARQKLTLVPSPCERGGGFCRDVNSLIQSRISIVSTKYDFCRSLRCSRKRIVALHRLYGFLRHKLHFLQKRWRILLRREFIHSIVLLLYKK